MILRCFLENTDNIEEYYENIISLIETTGINISSEIKELLDLEDDYELAINNINILKDFCYYNEFIGEYFEYNILEIDVDLDNLSSPILREYEGFGGEKYECICLKLFKSISIDFISSIGLDIDSVSKEYFEDLYSFEE